MTEDRPDDLAEAAHDLFSGTCTFLIGATRVADLPAHQTVEVAFAGRSNVGKSSLMNALIGRRDVARTSKEPGRTRELNFFRLEGRDGSAAIIADLPGYGYAKAPKAVVARWTALIMDYLAGRPHLRRVFLLIDSRHGMKPNDADVAALLDKAAVSYQVVLTKTDKVTAAELEETKAAVTAALLKHPAAHPEIIATSSLKATGIEALRLALARLVRDA
jgi:GTP-binding protein